MKQETHSEYVESNDFLHQMNLRILNISIVSTLPVFFVFVSAKSAVDKHLQLNFHKK